MYVRMYVCVYVRTYVSLIAQASSFINAFDMHHTTPTFITEVFCIVTYVKLLNDCSSKSNELVIQW